jgi:hypothetical protein
MRTTRQIALTLALVAMLTPALAGARNPLARPGSKGRPASSCTLPRPFNLKTEMVGGKPHYVTYRVESKQHAGKLMDPKNSFRWFGSNTTWQYGQGFYLFGHLSDAKKFIKCSKNMAQEIKRTHPAAKIDRRETILKIMLPKETFDTHRKAQVPGALDWAVDRSSSGYNQLRDLRQNHLVFGRWKEDPAHPTQSYQPMTGTPQFAVIQRGMPSILNQAVLKIVEPGR